MVAGPIVTQGRTQRGRRPAAPCPDRRSPPPPQPPDRSAPVSPPRRDASTRETSRKLRTLRHRRRPACKDQNIDTSTRQFMILYIAYDTRSFRDM